MPTQEESAFGPMFAIGQSTQASGAAGTVFPGAGTAGASPGGGGGGGATNRASYAGPVALGGRASQNHVALIQLNTAIRVVGVYDESELRWTSRRMFTAESGASRYRRKDLHRTAPGVLDVVCRLVTFYLSSYYQGCT